MDISLRATNSPTAKEVTVGNVTILFSYETPVAFHKNGLGYIVRENDWGSTTGKHIKAFAPHIPKDRRYSGDEFADLLDLAVTRRQDA